MENEKILEQSSQDQRGSQLNSVNRFGVSPSDKNEVQDIKNKIDGTRNRNLRENTAPMSLGGSAPSSLGENPGLGESPSSSKKSSTSLGETKKETKSSASGSKKNESSSNVSGNKSALGGLGSAAANTALNIAANNNEVAAKAINTARMANMAIKVIKKLVAFFSSPIGWGVGVTIIVIAIISFIIIFPSLIVSALGMKFGLPGDDTLEIFNEEYNETLTRDQIDDIMAESDSKMCKEGFFTGLKHVFGIWNLENSCEFAHYVKKIIEEKEKLNGIDTVSPGYFLSALYYSFDTQNFDEDGELFIKPSDYLDNDTSSEDIEMINDLDAITTLIAAKIYNKNTVDTLLEKYIFHNYYTYWVYEYIPPENPADEGYWDCVDYQRNDYKVDENKLKLYLRYGDNVTNAYVYETNQSNAYSATSSQCLNNLNFNKPNLSKYDGKADTNTSEDDEAKITISAGSNYSSFGSEPFKSGTYGYNDGFIFKTYPRYNSKYIISGQVTYDFMVDKDIEKIIQNVESRQDYINYVLGYPSTVQTELSQNNSGAGGGSCTYNVGGIDMKDVKVRLLYGKYDPDGKAYKPIENQELISFEDYITGVVYSEISGKEEEASKAQAIAARTYAFAYGEFYNRLVEEDGQWILNMVNSNEAQAYCDPNKGCYKGCDSGYNVIFSEGTVPAGVTCSIHKPAISKDSVIRKAVRETVGMILLNSEGKPEIINNRGVFGYRDVDQKEWIEMAENGSTYEQILAYAYPNGKININKCTVTATGWALPLDEPWNFNSCFGTRIDPITHKKSYHSGVDLGKPKDSPIYTIGDGVIAAVVPASRGGSLGNYVKVDHGNGYVSIYGHMNKHFEGLEVGDIVNAGQQIGYVGSTGRSTGNHLHLMVQYNGENIDPVELVGIDDQGKC